MPAQDPAQSSACAGAAPELDAEMAWLCGPKLMYSRRLSEIFDVLRDLPVGVDVLYFLLRALAFVKELGRQAVD